MFHQTCHVRFLRRVKLLIQAKLIIAQMKVTGNEPFEEVLLLRVGLQFQQTVDSMRVHPHPRQRIGRVAHADRQDAGHHIGMRRKVCGLQAGQLHGPEAKAHRPATVRLQAELASDSATPEKDHNHRGPFDLLGQRQTGGVMQQPQRRETRGHALLLEQHHHVLALAVGPRDTQWRVHLEEAITQAPLGQLLPQRTDGEVAIQREALLRQEEGQCLPGIGKDQVLEVLVVAGVRRRLPTGTGRGVGGIWNRADIGDMVCIGSMAGITTRCALSQRLARRRIAAAVWFIAGVHRENPKAGVRAFQQGRPALACDKCTEWTDDLGQMGDQPRACAQRWAAAT